jgi:hypothetical protein
MGSAVRRARCAALATGRARSHPDWPRRQASSASSSPGRRAGRSDAGPSAAGRSSHLVRPLDAGVLVGVSVLEASNLARLAAEHAEKVGALLVGAALVAGVAGGALCLEDLGASLGLAVVGTRHSCLVFCQAANSDVWSSAGGVSPRFGRQRRPQWAARRLQRGDGPQATSWSPRGCCGTGCGPGELRRAQTGSEPFCGWCGQSREAAIAAHGGLSSRLCDNLT